MEYKSSWRHSRGKRITLWRIECLNFFSAMLNTFMVSTGLSESVRQWSLSDFDNHYKHAWIKFETLVILQKPCMLMNIFTTLPRSPAIILHDSIGPRTTLWKHLLKFIMRTLLYNITLALSLTCRPTLLSLQVIDRKCEYFLNCVHNFQQIPCSYFYTVRHNSQVHHYL